jgi:hypothetical protein
MVFLALLFLAGSAGAASPALVDVTRADGVLVAEPLVPDDRDAARANTLRMHAIMEAAPPGAAVRFPAGAYFFDGSALPNRGSVESTRPGQVFFGDGADVTRLVQVNAEKDFGFTQDPRRKHVPAATVRLRHSACRLRDLTVMVDPELPADRLLPTAAVQLAHIAYFPDHSIGIIETTGLGADFLLDNVIVERVYIGHNPGGGIQGRQYFEYGIDIIGSGGMVKVRDIERLDAKHGVRLDNGNHCGQGDYTFKHLYMVGRPPLTNGGVFFDWIGGQLPMIVDCEAVYTNMFHAGPLGVNGDRLEPFPEGEVVRSADRDWDWLTWHGHPVVAEPDEAQRTEWYGLPRQAKVVRIGSEPRTGGTEWAQGSDYTVERVTEPGPCEGASRIRWTGSRPDPGAMYFVTFEQPKEYRVHDLQWGYVKGCFFGEANQAGGKGFVYKLNDQGFGTLNPDFHFPVGYQFIISGNTHINGDSLFQGRVGFVKYLGNGGGVSNLRVEGLGENRQVTETLFADSTFNSVSIGDHTGFLSFRSNRIEGPFVADSGKGPVHLSVEQNLLTTAKGPAIDIRRARNLRLAGNTVWCPEGDAIRLENVTNGIVTGTIASDCGGAGLDLHNGKNLLVTGNLFTGNADGIRVKGGEGIVVKDNLPAD